MSLLRQFKSLFKRGCCYYSTKTKIHGDLLNFYSRKDKLLGSVDRNKVSEIWAVNIDVEPYPTYSVWKVLFVTRGKQVRNINTVSVVAEHADVTGTIRKFLVSLGGMELPDFPDQSDMRIDSWREVRLLWQRKKPNNREIRSRIDFFERERFGVYFSATMLLLSLGIMLIAARWWPIISYCFGGLFAAYCLLCFLLSILMTVQWANDLKRIGIHPQWFGKIVNPNVKLHKKDNSKDVGKQ